MLDSFPEPDARLLVMDDADAVAREAARRFVSAASRSVEAGTMFRVALAGGGTPLGLYRVLASDDAMRYSVHWPSVELYWGDERFVPDDHADSNYGAARRALLDPLRLESRQIHPIPTEEIDPESAATTYQETLARSFGISGSEAPRFDLIFLGLGSDAHTASLFPGAIPEGGPDRWVAAVRHPADGSSRITLMPSVINAARQVLFLVTGSGKAEALERVMRAVEPDPQVPASLIRPAQGGIAWLTDRAAAERVTTAPEREPGGTPEGRGR